MVNTLVITINCETFLNANKFVLKNDFVPKERLSKLCETVKDWYRTVFNEHFNKQFIGTSTSTNDCKNIL